MTKEETKKVSGNIKDQDWYIAMIEESTAILSERGYNIRMDLIQLKWDIGNRIIQERGNFKRFGYGEKMVETVAQDINISRTELFYCIQFAKKYPELSTIMDNFGKDITWTTIKEDHLPESSNKGEQKHYMTCLLDKEEKIIWIKEKYRDYKIKYKDDQN